MSFPWFDAPTTTSTTTNGNMAWLQPQWASWLSNVSNITPQAMPVYGGPTVAPLSQNQTTSFDMARQLAMNGTPAYNAATGAIGNVASGNAVNPYMGTDPYTQQVINGTNQNMIDAYQRGTAAQTDAAMARQGAYGGSAYNELTAANNKAFGQALGNVDAGLLNQNFYNNANLYQQGVQTQLGAAGLGLGSQTADLNAINALGNAGATQNAYTQNILNAMQNYWNQTVQAPFVSSSIVGNALSQAGGSPTSTTTTQQGVAQSPWSMLGLLPIAASIFGG